MTSLFFCIIFINCFCTNLIFYLYYSLTHLVVFLIFEKYFSFFVVYSTYLRNISENVSKHLEFSFCTLINLHYKG